MLNYTVISNYIHLLVLNEEGINMSPKTFF
jgi:hypothetical protein